MNSTWEEKLPNRIDRLWKGLRFAPKRTDLKISFWGGPVDGVKFDCPLVPPTDFYLPTETSLLVSVYEFSSINCNYELVYVFEGYEKISEKEASLLMDAAC